MENISPLLVDPVAENASAGADILFRLLMDYVSRGSHHERSQFRSGYDRTPIVNPGTRYRRELGSARSDAHFASVQKKRRIFQDFIEHIFGSDTIMVTPFKFDEPNARGKYRPRSTVLMHLVPLRPYMGLHGSVEVDQKIMAPV